MTWFEDFAKFAHSNLTEEIVESLNVRGVSDEQVEQFNIGYVNKKLPPDCPLDFTKQFHGGDKLSHMYCFPLSNTIGQIKGFQFRPVNRAIRGYQDYVNQHGEPILFGLGQAMPHVWETGTITVVEGVFDLFPLQRHLGSTVACLSAHIPESMIRTMGRLCKKIILGFDNDPTGRRSSIEFQREYKNKYEIVDLGAKYPKTPMPNGKVVKDPGDLWEVWGDAKVGELVSRWCK